MQISNYQKERVAELRASISSARRFGVNTDEREKVLENLENELITTRFQALNDAFIQTHKWHKIYASDLERWDLVLYEGQVCKVEGVFSTYYDAGSDTYSYTGTLRALFADTHFKISFDYYKQIETLAID